MMIYHTPSGSYTCFDPTSRAYGLLQRHLTHTQRDELQSYGYFTVAGSSGKTYRIHAFHGRNVVLMEGGKGVAHYDAHIKGTGETIPLYDNLLAQKLALESNDWRFRFAACGHKYDDGMGMGRSETWGWPMISFMLIFIPCCMLAIGSLVGALCKIAQLLVRP